METSIHKTYLQKVYGAVPTAYLRSTAYLVPQSNLNRCAEITDGLFEHNLNNHEFEQS